MRGPFLYWFFLFSGCGEGFDLLVPIQINSEIPEAVGAVRVGIEALGGRVGPSRTQISIQHDPQCLCDRHTDTIACGSSVLRSIRVCPRWFTHSEPNRTRAMLHELGHVVGGSDHASCESGAIMAPGLNCIKLSTYGEVDLTLICQYARGGRCP